MQMLINLFYLKIVMEQYEQEILNILYQTREMLQTKETKECFTALIDSRTFSGEIIFGS